jgi:hypothetical protein
MITQKQIDAREEYNSYRHKSRKLPAYHDCFDDPIELVLKQAMADADKEAGEL